MDSVVKQYLKEINKIKGKTFTIKTSKEIISLLDQLKKILNKSRNQIVNEAIEDYIERHFWKIVAHNYSKKIN